MASAVLVRKPSDFYSPSHRTPFAHAPHFSSGRN